MKNKHERMREAQAFANEKSAYLHVEVRNGKHDGTVMAGDPAVVMLGILSVLRRLAEISGIAHAGDFFNRFYTKVPQSVLKCRFLVPKVR